MVLGDVMPWWLDVVGHKKRVWDRDWGNSKCHQVGKLRSRLGGKSVSSVWGTLSLRQLGTSWVNSLIKYCAGVEVLVVKICSQIVPPFVNAGIWNWVKNWEGRAGNRFRLLSLQVIAQNMRLGGVAQEQCAECKRVNHWGVPPFQGRQGLHEEDAVGTTWQGQEEPGECRAWNPRQKDCKGLPRF